jgi:lipopolysaccharide assembly outer membrane protein LptD (OstA)
VFNGVDGKERFGKGIGRNLYFLQDTLKRNQDTLKKHLQDSLAKDSLRKGSLSGPAFSGANDSIIEKNVEGRKMIYYYHDANVKYLNFELKAAYMEYDIDNKIVLAKGLPDTSGVIQGKPVMTMDGRSYTMDQVIYNFNTGKSRMYNLITQQDEGFLHGDKLKMLPDHSINISGGKYTVCDLDHPHFYLKMPVARVVTGDNPLTVFGPSYLVLEDVPTPFFLPFGFVPKMKNRAGGLLIPNYGEEVSRGFFMKGLGYYFVLGNNLDLSVTGDIYSMGSWNLLVTSRYKKRYKYDGTFSMNISNNQVGEKGGPDFVQSRDFSLQWNHTQDSKARPGTSFSASVNFSSPSNNRYNSTSIQTTLQNQISSSVSYSRTWAGTPLSFSANALHNQNSLDSSYSISFPSMRFNVSTIYPFRNYKSAGKRKFYEDISFAYNTTLENNVKFKASQVKDPDFMSLFKSGMKHNFQIGLPTFSVLKYLQFSPSIAYGMNWYFQQTTKEYDTETGEVVDKMSDLFSSFGTTHDFSAGLSGNTRITGIFNLGKKFYIQKIRHLITPSVGFSFRPEMGTSWNGYRKYSYIDNNGEQHILSYNKYAGQLNSPPSTGRSAAITFSLMNNFEGKVADPQDTTGGGFKVIKLIDNLSLSGNYNLLADSLKLSNISATMSTTVFGKLSVNANANLDPYAIDEKGNKINTFNIVKKGGLNFARLMNASMSFSYQFSGEGKGGGGGSAPAQNNDSNQGNTSGNTSKSDFGGVKTEEILYKRIYYHPVTGEYIPGGWVYYLEPDIPWSVNINYSMSYSKSYSYASSLLTTKNNYIQTLGFGFQLRPTKALNFNLNSGYDISNKKLTTTQLSATYDLHCFVITFSWIPQGQWQSWSFRINAKASALADLLQFKKNASYWDRTQ